MANNGQGVQRALEKDVYQIGEVSRITETKAFVLRYWETEFPMLRPAKNPRGHRMYRREDIETVLKIKRLLYDEGFTIAGARRHLREANGAAQRKSSSADRAQLLSRKVLLDLRDALRAFLTLLERR